MKYRTMRLWYLIQAAGYILFHWQEMKAVVQPALQTLEREVQIHQQHRASLSRIDRLASPVRLELGCADFRRQGWIGIDIHPAADLQLDLRRPLPFSESSVDEIHSEHFLEHLSLADGRRLLRECHRVLKPNGVISLSVPNLKPYLQAYNANEVDFLRERIFDTPPDKGYEHTALDILNWFALREGEHLFMYDDENLQRRLEEAGFRGIHIRDFDNTRDYNFRQSSVYVQGVK